jgi:hypothetical protein
MRPASTILLVCLVVQIAVAGDSTAGETHADRPAALDVRHVASLACINPDTGLRFSPLGLALDLAGDLYVVDGDNSGVLTLEDAAGPPVFFADCPETLEGCRFTDIVADAGWFYISDPAHGLVLVLDSQGRLVKTCAVGAAVGGMGLGDAGQIYAAMTVSGSIVILDVYAEQSVITCPLPSGPEGSCPVDCLVEKASRVLVTDAFSGKVIVLGILGQYLEALEGFNFASPFGICSVRGRVTLVSDSRLGVVAAFGPRGKFLGTFGGGVLVTPGFIEAGDDGTIWVADTGRMTIEVFKLEESEAAQD